MQTDFIYCVFVSLEIDTLGSTAVPPFVSATDAAASHRGRLDSVLIITKSARVLSLLAWKQEEANKQHISFALPQGVCRSHALKETSIIAISQAVKVSHRGKRLRIYADLDLKVVIPLICLRPTISTSYMLT